MRTTAKLCLIAIVCGLVALQAVAIASADDAGSEAVLIDAGSASEPVPVTTTTTTTTTTPTATTVEVPLPALDLPVKLWRTGAFACAGIVALYLLATFWLKVDKKRALYAAAGIAGLTMLLESATRGVTPNLSMIVSALAMVAGIIAKGPDKPVTAAPTA